MLKNVVIFGLGFVAGIAYASYKFDEDPIDLVTDAKDQVTTGFNNMKNFVSSAAKPETKEAQDAEFKPVEEV